MKFFNLLLLICNAQLVYSASSCNDYSPISQQETSPQAKPRLSDERRMELVKVISRGGLETACCSQESPEMSELFSPIDESNLKNNPVKACWLNHIRTRCTKNFLGCSLMQFFSGLGLGLAFIPLNHMAISSAAAASAVEPISICFACLLLSSPSTLICGMKLDWWCIDYLSKPDTWQTRAPETPTVLHMEQELRDVASDNIES